MAFRNCNTISAWHLQVREQLEHPPCAFVTQRSAQSQDTFGLIPNPLANKTFIWGRDEGSTSGQLSATETRTRFRDETESPVNNGYLKTNSIHLQKADPQLSRPPGFPLLLIRSRRPAGSVGSPGHRDWVHPAPSRSQADSHFGRKEGC